MVTDRKCTRRVQVYHCEVRSAAKDFLLRWEPVGLELDTGSGDSQWLARWARDRKVMGSSPGGRSGGRIFFLQGQHSVLTLISVSLPPPCYRSSTKMIPVVLPKVQVAGYS